MQPFRPPRLLANPHLQSILASTGPRKFAVQFQAKQLLAQASRHIIDCGPIDDEPNIRLQGEYTPHPKSKGLVILIHGWLGGDKSLYLLSAGSYLYTQGYSIFRLNLRDHGDTGHLNRGIFNSTRITEVVRAIESIQQRFPYTKYVLTGFSLGGNFSLRVAAQQSDSNFYLHKVIAVCPVIDPYKTNRSLNNNADIYHNYFLKKWRRNLLEKLRHFPDYDYFNALMQLRTLDDMNAFFVPRYTGYNSVAEYFQGYRITQPLLDRIVAPCQIISSQDDPVIASADLAELSTTKNVNFQLTPKGGHCGFIQSLRMDSWIDRQIADEIGRI